MEDETEVRSQEEIQRIFNDADDDGNGNLSFEEVRQAILQHMLFEVQPGRYYVFVSLAEAETLRALLHGRSGQPLIPESGASIALRHISTPWNSKSASLIEKSKVKHGTVAAKIALINGSFGSVFVASK